MLVVVQLLKKVLKIHENDPDTALLNSRLRSRIYKPDKIIKSDICSIEMTETMGYGVFNRSNRTIYPGETVCYYYGVIVTNDEYNTLEKMVGSITTGMRIPKLFGVTQVLNVIGFNRIHPGAPIIHAPTRNRTNTGLKEYANVSMMLPKEKVKAGIRKGLFPPDFCVVIADETVEPGDQYFYDYGEHAMEIINSHCHKPFKAIQK